MKEKSSTLSILERAVAAKRSLAGLSEERMNSALTAMAEALTDSTEAILAANESDIEAASGKIGEVMLDRLRLTEKRICDMASGIEAIATLESCLGRTIESITRPNGLIIEKRAVPIGVVAIIYESRPNVTSDAAALCLKSGNVCVLRCGKEAHRSAEAIVRALRAGLEKARITPDAVQLIEDTGRESANELMRAEGYVDLLIPRGGKGLIRACIENATVPCIETGTGICHVYVDSECDLNMAARIIENAKTSRPSVCNAMEVLLVHRMSAPALLPMLSKKLIDNRLSEGLCPVELRCDGEALKYCKGVKADECDFDTEFLDYALAVKVVGSLDEAIAHIEKHSTHHSDCIITSIEKSKEEFVSRVDSAAVYVNASTRFTDGGEFGLGCEMGISTQKLHARGPMGIRELTTYKYVVVGNGQIR